MEEFVGKGGGGEGGEGEGEGWWESSKGQTDRQRQATDNRQQASSDKFWQATRKQAGWLSRRHPPGRVSPEILSDAWLACASPADARHHLKGPDPNPWVRAEAIYLDPLVPIRLASFRSRRAQRLTKNSKTTPQQNGSRREKERGR